jgi:hypothetical protein
MKKFLSFENSNTPCGKKTVNFYVKILLLFLSARSPVARPQGHALAIYETNVSPISNGLTSTAQIPDREPQTYYELARVFPDN